MVRRDRNQTPSGRFVLRIDPGLHALLRQAARDTGVSLNEYCSRKLAAPMGQVMTPGRLGQVVERAAALLAADLVGVLVFGSWSRGELVDGSDVDVLIVIEDRVRLGRGLYRAWDAEPLRCRDRPVEPQFVHLPDPGETVAGLWAEVAMDGILLFDRGLRVAARLVQIRGDILTGRIVRRFAQGQPYWVRNEVA
ncbi:MAG: toxin-antitoxin system HicB family antitoxin [Acidobacteriota bacterium]